MPSNRLKVLLLTSDYWPDPGGIAAHVYYLARALAQKGADVSVIGGHRKAILSEGNERESAEGLHEVSIRKSGPRGLRGAVFMLRAAMALLLKRRAGWNVVHFHNFFPDALIARFSKESGPQVKVMTNHSSLMLEMIDQGRSLSLLRTLVSQVDGIIGPSPELAEKSLKIAMNSQPVEYIPNGVDVDLFAPGHPSPETLQLLKSGRAQRLILAVRRHDPKCGLPFLVEAAGSILRKHDDVIFCLAGQGEQTDLLKRMVAERGLDTRFRFLGAVSHEILPSIFHAAYVSVLPSLYEAVSLSGLESMACGVPVIGTRIGGIPEFVHHGITGLLIEPKDPQAIAEAITELLDNPQARDTMAENARDLVVSKFSWESVADSTLAFYRSLLNPRFG